MLKYLEALCGLDGVSGWEDAVRDFVRAKASPWAEEIYEDSIGNLFVLKKGAERRNCKLMVCAHMDEVGLLIQKITDEGYLKFEFVGGVDRRVVIGKRVRIGASQLPGIIGVKAVHLSTKEERKKVPKLDELYIDIGATTKAQAEKLVRLGDFAAFDSSYTLFGDGLVKSKALDDRLGCAVMLELLEEPLAYDTWFVFTVQEEVGLRGATCAAYSLAPDVALVIEGTTAADLPDTEGAKQVCSVRSGAVIGCMDRSTIYDPAYFRLLCEQADKLGIPWQIKQLVAGGTDAGAIHKSRGGVRTACIAAPVRYIHSPSCVTSCAAMDAVYSLARAFVNAHHENGKD